MSRERLTIHEVGPRDGLQNEKSPVPAAGKVILLRALRGAGISSIEATSFVSPKAVPQMADAPEVLQATLEDPGAHYAALIINEKGYERALEAGCKSIAIVVVISETLSLKNSRMTVEEGIISARALLRRAKEDGIRTRVYIAPAWVCPYEGAMDQDQVLRCADPLWSEGVDELAIADTIGHAHPLEVGRLLEKLGHRYDMARLAAHFHDTQALGLANAAAAISAGVRTIDGSIAGLGGCPFAPGAAGNLATEDLVFMAHKMGFETGVDLEALRRVAKAVDDLVGRRVGGRTRVYFESQEKCQAVASA